MTRSETDMTPSFRVVGDFRARLGEGAHWDAKRQRLWLVDILLGNVHWIEPVQNVFRTRHVGSMVGWVIPVADSDHLLLGLRDGVAVLNVSDPVAVPKMLFTDRRYPPTAALRLNDAKVDAHGKVWCGCVSVEDESQPIASLARIELSSGRVEIVDEGYKVANGPAFSPDGTFMLHSDSAMRLVYRFDLDPSSGEVLGKRIWKAFAEGEGCPDGMNFDAAGNVWIAFWGAGKVGCFTPSGICLLDLKLPTKFVTNVCFGGPQLDQLYVTSASPDADDQPRSNYPLAGALFEVSNIAAFGLPCREARL
jgi:D-xylonolactonase